MWEMWECFIKCGQNFENVGNVGPLGTLHLRHDMIVILVSINPIQNIYLGNLFV